MESVGVIGLGLMGRSIADLCLDAGLPVIVFDSFEKALDDFCAKREQTGRTVSRAQSLAEFAEATIVFEAIAESADAKRELYKGLNNAVPHAILASNSSTYLPSELAEELDDPSRLLVCHFFNPANIVPLVEVVPGPVTRPEVTTAAFDFLTELGKQPVILDREVPGFIANRLQAAILRECAALLESGTATAETIDHVVRTSLGPRWAACGPLAVADLGGLDIFVALSNRLLPDMSADDHAAGVFQRHVAAGELGAKSGGGLYQWSSEDVQRAQQHMVDFFALPESHKVRE